MASRPRRNIIPRSRCSGSEPAGRRAPARRPGRLASPAGGQESRSAFSPDIDRKSTRFGVNQVPTAVKPAGVLDSSITERLFRVLEPSDIKDLIRLYRPCAARACGRGRAPDPVAAVRAGSATPARPRNPRHLAARARILIYRKDRFDSGARPTRPPWIAPTPITPCRPARVAFMRAPAGSTPSLRTGLANPIGEGRRGGDLASARRAPADRDEPGSGARVAPGGRELAEGRP
jgi:hypothetical protein